MLKRQMNEREQKILEAIVREYIITASPVGSLSLRRQYSFPFSPATIRNVMSNLEELGYIFQPYTSAGRVPTEKGYRFYVNLMKDKDSLISFRELEALKKKIFALSSSYEKMLEFSAKLLTDLSLNAGIAGTSEQFFKYGISNLMKEPEAKHEEYSRGVAGIYEHFENIAEEVQDERTEVFIGDEGPFGKDAGCSVIFSKFMTPFGITGFVGILGPIRMNYEKNIALVSFVKDILKGKN